MSNVSAQLDARGLNCPLPIFKTTKALKQLQPGQILEVIASDPGSLKDMAAFCEQTGHTLKSSQEADNAYVFLIEKH